MSELMNNNNRRGIHADVLFEQVRMELAEGRKAKIRVSGSSMWPLLCHGRDFVILKAVEPEKIRKGDIVLLRKEDGDYLLHRVSGVKKDMIETKGDNKLEKDGWFPRTSVIGVADSVVRKGREFSGRNVFVRMVMEIRRRMGTRKVTDPRY